MSTLRHLHPLSSLLKQLRLFFLCGEPTLVLSWCTVIWNFGTMCIHDGEPITATWTTEPERDLRPTPVVAPFVVVAGVAARGGVVGLMLVLIVGHLNCPSSLFGVGRTGANSSLRALLLLGGIWRLDAVPSPITQFIGWQLCGGRRCHGKGRVRIRITIRIITRIPHWDNTCS